MKRVRTTEKRVHKKSKAKKAFVISACTVASLLISVYLLYVSPTKKDIKRIEGFLNSYAKLNEIEIIPEGIPQEAKSRVAELDNDIMKVESSIFFRLNSTTYLKIAVFYFDSGDFNKSLAYVDKSLQRAPLNFNARLLRSALSFYQGLFNNSISDINAVITNSLDEQQLAIAYMFRALVRYLSGDLNNSKNDFVKSCDLLKDSDISQVILLCNYYFLSSVCMDLGEYDKGDSFYIKSRELGLVLEKNLDKNDKFINFIIALIEHENDLEKAKALLASLVDQQDDNIFSQIITLLIKTYLASENNNEIIAITDKAIALCENSGITYFQYLFSIINFVAELELKKAVNLEKLKSIWNSTVKIPGIEASVYQGIGAYYQKIEEYDLSISSFEAALEKARSSGALKDIIDAEFTLGFVQYKIRNYYSSNKMFKSAIKAIENILGSNHKESYQSKRAQEEITQFMKDRKILVDYLDLQNRLFK